MINVELIRSEEQLGDCRTGFMTFLPALPLEQSAVIRYWRGLGLSSLQLWMKYGEHEDLCGSDRRSITSYIHGEDCCIVVCSSS
jgi:hypothetical protein